MSGPGDRIVTGGRYCFAPMGWALPASPSAANHGPLARLRAGVAAGRFAAPNLPLFAAGLILPNLLSLATLTSLIDVGLPPRTGCILMYATLAMAARAMPFALTAVLYVPILAFDLVWTLSVSFGLRPQDLVTALHFAERVRVFESLLYVVLIGVIVATSGATLTLLAQRARLRRGNAAALLAAAVALAGADYVSNSSPYFAFGAMLGRGVPVQSAVDDSGFGAVAGVDGRNAVLVVVESLGQLSDPQARGQIDAPLFDPRVTQKYKVTSGSITYFGSTTSAEMRELCHTREPYADYVKTSGFSCMPQRLHMRGYATMAVHGFTRTFFDRETWYPTVGFDKDVFGVALAKQTRRLCGGAFRGACDADLPPVIAQEAAFSSKPKFIYWLTLNTHIPIAPGEALTRYHCSRDPDRFNHLQVCRMAELWHDLFGAVARLALDPSIGPADILVVGDHAPPLWSKQGRAQFVPGRVPWYRLSPRDGVVAAQDRQHASAASVASR